MVIYQDIRRIGSQSGSPIYIPTPRVPSYFNLKMVSHHPPFPGIASSSVESQESLSNFLFRRILSSKKARRNVSHFHCTLLGILRILSLSRSRNNSNHNHKPKHVDIPPQPLLSPLARTCWLCKHVPLGRGNTTAGNVPLSPPLFLLQSVSQLFRRPSRLIVFRASDSRPFSAVAVGGRTDVDGPNTCSPLLSSTDWA